MIDQKNFERLALLAYEWAKDQEGYILKHGAPLAGEQIADARRAGVEETTQVRILVVDRMPMPDDKELADAARRAQILTDSSKAATIGHGIIVRADSWQDRELLLHQLVHVAQCERSGGLKPYLNAYLMDRRDSRDFSLGSFEDEARSLAREICAGRRPEKQKASGR